MDFSTLSEIKARIQACVAAEIARVVSTDFVTTSRDCCFASMALRESLPQRLWGRADDIVASIVWVRLKRRERELLALASDVEFQAECDRRIAESIEHQEAAASEWLRTVSTFSQAVA